MNNHQLLEPHLLSTQNILAVNSICHCFTGRCLTVVHCLAVKLCQCRFVFAVVTLHAKLTGTVYCNWSCLCVCVRLSALFAAVFIIMNHQCLFFSEPET